MEMTAIPHGMKQEITDAASSDLEIQRNSICFISRLPTETLEVIFIHGACDYHREDSGHAIPTPPSWVNVPYVCRHWRSVALNCATLWTYLFITSSRWTEVLLARSMQAPLKLYANLHHNCKDNRSRGICFLEEVMSHVERIQELRLYLTTGHGGYQFLSKLPSPAPRLQSLEVTMDWYPSQWWSSVPFDGDTPALRTLDLTDCPVPWYSFNSNGLTTLTLCAVPVRFQQNTMDFLATLSCMRDLASLYLEDALADSADFLASMAFNTFQRFNLPRLSRLFLDAPLSTIVALLSCVNIPLRTKARVYCRVEQNSSSLDHYTLLSSLLAQRFTMFEDQAPSSPIIRSLVIIFPTWGGAKLTFSTSERDCDSRCCIMHGVGSQLSGGGGLQYYSSDHP